MEALQSITDEEFDKLVLDAKNPVVIKFTATWCRPCKALNPVLLSLKKRHRNIHFYEVDIEANFGLAEDFGIRSVPTTMIFNEGVAVGRVHGIFKEIVFRSVLSMF